MSALKVVAGIGVVVSAVYLLTKHQKNKAERLRAAVQEFHERAEAATKVTPLFMGDASALKVPEHAYTIF